MPFGSDGGGMSTEYGTTGRGLLIRGKGGGGPGLRLGGPAFRAAAENAAAPTNALGAARRRRMASLDVITGAWGYGVGLRGGGELLPRGNTLGLSMLGGSGGSEPALRGVVGGVASWVCRSSVSAWRSPMLNWGWRDQRTGNEPSSYEQDEILLVHRALHKSCHQTSPELAGSTSS